jgi:hypothetical protein
MLVRARGLTQRSPTVRAIGATLYELLRAQRLRNGLGLVLLDPLGT